MTSPKKRAPWIAAAFALSFLVTLAVQAQAAFPYIRIPAAACVAQRGSPTPDIFSANVGNTNIGNATLHLACPIATDEPSSYNQFNFHFVDNDGGAAGGDTVVANACVTFFAVTGGSCFGSFSHDPGRTASGKVTAVTYPVFDTWENHPADFAFVDLKVPPRFNCGGLPCWGESFAVGVFVFQN